MFCRCLFVLPVKCIVALIMQHIIETIREELHKYSDKETQAGSQRFFKEPIKCYGVKSAVVKKISKNFFNHIKAKPKTEIFSLCECLWQSGYLEESFIACNWSYYIHKHYISEDLQVFEKWIKQYVNNWASCDTLCNHTVGTFMMMYPGYVKRLKVFAKSSNRWLRRAAAVSLIIPARKGMFLKDIFDIADLLLSDQDDLVQKGYGWMLKATSEANREEVFAYVVKHKSSMPRTALRYAIEKMPDDLRSIAMKKN